MAIGATSPVGGDPMEDERLSQLPDAPLAREWWLWAKQRDLPLQALALQFPLRHSGISSVVVGASNQREIEENIAAVRLEISEDLLFGSAEGRLVRDLIQIA